jgi:hypothetical protein
VANDTCSVSWALRLLTKSAVRIGRGSTTERSISELLSVWGTNQKATQQRSVDVSVHIGDSCFDKLFDRTLQKAIESRVREDFTRVYC